MRTSALTISGATVPTQQQQHGAIPAYFQTAAAALNPAFLAQAAAIATVPIPLSHHMNMAVSLPTIGLAQAATSLGFGLSADPSAILTPVINPSEPATMPISGATHMAMQSNPLANLNAAAAAAAVHRSSADALSSAFVIPSPLGYAHLNANVTAPQPNGGAGGSNAGRRCPASSTGIPSPQPMAFGHSGTLRLLLLQVQQRFVTE